MKNITKILILVTVIIVTSANSLFAERFKGDVKAFQTKAEASCLPAVNSNELSINNVKAYIQTNGTMWNKEVALYEIPNGSGKTSMFAAALWIGGRDASNQLKLAAIRFNQVGEDFYTGPLSTTDASIPKTECARWDRHFKITRQEVDDFIAYHENGKVAPYDGYVVPKSILDWPAHPMDWVQGTATPNGQSPYLAPFKDVDGDGFYNPDNGDYPYYDINNELCPWTPENIQKAAENALPLPPEDPEGRMGMRYADHVLKGDETLFWIFNDNGNAHTESGGQPIGLEIRGQAFAFATNDELNNMTFYSYEIINRSTFELRNTYFSKWVDPDLGYSHDDYVGCDVVRGLGYCYNATDVDGSGQAWAYGTNPPAVGVDFFQGPYIDADGKDNPKFFIDSVTTAGYCERFVSSADEYDQMAINGVNFGDGIKDNERYGMRRFVYHNNDDSETGDPRTAVDYYNMLQAIWRDNERMVYGSNGYPGTNTGPECDFMFPADTDPCAWGTKGMPHGLAFPNSDGWTERNVGNPVTEDRRFMQSAGPFTLRAGAVNYITVGIPWARATSGGAWASVVLLKSADDKCQALFENCFKVIDGPDAPELTIVEQENQLILLIDNVNNNNVNESYEEMDNQIPETLPGDSVELDRKYRFEGYIVYQLKNKDVSVTDLENLDLARVVAQCDIENYRSNGTAIGQLINMVYDESLGLPIPKEMVSGTNEGIKHSFLITEDAFALGDKALVNHKTYYYMVLAYAYNEYAPFSMTTEGLNGQQRPFLAGRRGIKVVPGIPHKSQPHGGGTELRAQYGTQPEISRIEGQGNGGAFLEMKAECVEQILQNNKISKIDYEINGGPIDVKVIDPLKVKPYNYTLKLMDSSYYNTPDQADVTDSSYWILTIDNQLTQDELLALGFDSEGKIISDRPISVQNEQLLTELGISITMKNYNFKINQPELLEYILERGPAPRVLNWHNLTKWGQVDYIDSKIVFDNPTQPWITGVIDNDFDYPNNWIRSGNNNTGRWDHTTVTDGAEIDYSRWRTEDCFMLYMDNPQGTDAESYRAYKDYRGDFEKTVGGTWSPYVLASPYVGGPQAKYTTQDTLLYGGPDISSEPSPAYYSFQAIASLDQLPSFNMTMTNLYSVDVVMTNDKSKWTRCVVLEACTDSRYSEGNALRHEPRKSKSKDKDGKTSDSNEPSDDPNHPNFISAYGMGWFPGYAINIETGERLNIMFAEDSSDPKNNGTDMKFNPTGVYGYLFLLNNETGVIDTTEISMDLYNMYYDMGAAQYMMFDSDGNSWWISRTPVWGGKHFLYVCGSSGNTSAYYYRGLNYVSARNFNDANRIASFGGGNYGGFLNGDESMPYYECGVYDHGKWLMTKFSTFVDSPDDFRFIRRQKMQLYSNVMWTSIPMGIKSSEWLNNDVKIKLRVSRPYMRYNSRWYDYEYQAGGDASKNHGFPMYQFSTENIAPIPNNPNVHKDLLSEINIVPNPYYGFSTYESTSLETYAKIVNLPDDCTISIYTVNGTLVKKVKKSSAGVSYVDWDLKNDAGIPISGGVYIIHVKADGIGERTLKFFCAMRPTDLNAF